jgi:formylglycine-generating enzyme required for sulfatase activity
MDLGIELPVQRLLVRKRRWRKDGREPAGKGLSAAKLEVSGEPTALEFQEIAHASVKAKIMEYPLLGQNNPKLCRESAHFSVICINTPSITEHRPTAEFMKRLLIVAAWLGLGALLATAATQNFLSMAMEYRDKAIRNFVNYLVAGERYPMMHALYELRFDVLKGEMNIKNRADTRECALRRTYGSEVPEEKQEFCAQYDLIIDFARKHVMTVELFEAAYLETEPTLLGEIERQKARKLLRVWIRHKVNCLTDFYRCSRDERKVLERLGMFEPAKNSMLLMYLSNLEKKLFPEEQILSEDFQEPAETRCTLKPTGAQDAVSKDMAFVPAGEFMMGGGPEPIREVKVDAFWIDRCEVTNYDYVRLAAQDPFLRKSTFPRKFHDGNYLSHWSDDLVPPFGQELNPVINVSWFAARYYCNSIGKRLPSEAEWEKAARGGSVSLYSFGDDVEFLRDYAWFSRNAFGSDRQVAGLLPNTLHLYDLHGNAQEWVYDWYAPRRTSTTDNPQGPIRGKYRVIKGGSWQDLPQDLEPGRRRDALPNLTASTLGFRCASDTPPQ